MGRGGQGSRPRHVRRQSQEHHQSEPTSPGLENRQSNHTNPDPASSSLMVRERSIRVVGRGGVGSHPRIATAAELPRAVEQPSKPSKDVPSLRIAGCGGAESRRRPFTIKPKCSKKKLWKGKGKPVATPKPSPSNLTPTRRSYDSSSSVSSMRFAEPEVNPAHRKAIPDPLFAYLSGQRPLPELPFSPRAESFQTNAQVSFTSISSEIQSPSSINIQRRNINKLARTLGDHAPIHLNSVARKLTGSASPSSARMPGGDSANEQSQVARRSSISLSIASSSVSESLETPAPVPNEKQTKTHRRSSLSMSSLGSLSFLRNARVVSFDRVTPKSRNDFPEDNPSESILQSHADRSPSPIVFTYPVAQLDSDYEELEDSDVWVESPLSFPSPLPSEESSLQLQEEDADEIKVEPRTPPSAPSVLSYPHRTSYYSSPRAHTAQPYPFSSERPDTPFLGIIQPAEASLAPNRLQPTETNSGFWNRRDIRDVINSLRSLK